MIVTTCYKETQQHIVKLMTHLVRHWVFGESKQSLTLLFSSKINRENDLHRLIFSDENFLLFISIKLLNVDIIWKTGHNRP